MIRVLIGDDDDTFREALTDVLGADARFEIVGTAASGTELVGLAAVAAADIALIDVRMPSGGVWAASALSDPDAAWAPLTVVAVSADTGAGTVASMLRAGATGYLAKGSVGAQLPDLVARCASGEAILAVPGSAEALRRLIGSALDSRAT